MKRRLTLLFAGDVFPRGCRAQRAICAATAVAVGRRSGIGNRRSTVAAGGSCEVLRHLSQPAPEDAADSRSTRSIWQTCGNHAEEWEKVVRKVRTGAMPPVGRPRPDKAIGRQPCDVARDGARSGRGRTSESWTPVAAASESRRIHQRRSRSARVEIDAASLLPADVAGHGFDNNADALTLSPALTERYLGAAAKISQMALGRPRGLPTPETFFVPADHDQGCASATICRSDRAAASRSAITFRPMANTCSRCGRKRTASAAGSRGSLRSRINSICGLDNVQVWTGTIGGPEFAGAVAARGAGTDITDDRDKQVIEALRFKAAGQGGLHLVQVYFAAKTSAYLEDLFDRSLHANPTGRQRPAQPFDGDDHRPPTGHRTCDSDSPSRRRC